MINLNKFHYQLCVVPKLQCIKTRPSHHALQDLLMNNNEKLYGNFFFGGGGTNSDGSLYLDMTLAVAEALIPNKLNQTSI